MKLVKRLSAYFIYEWQSLLIGLLLLVSAIAISVYLPMFASKLIDRLTHAYREGSQVPLAELTQFFGIYMGLQILNLILSFSGAVLLRHMTNRIGKILRDQAHAHMQKLPVSYFDDKPAGKVATRVVNDTEVILNNFFAVFANNVLINALTVIGAYWAIARINGWIALALLVLIPIIILWQLTYSRIIGPVNTAMRESYSNLNSHVAELVNGIGMVQIFGRQKYMVDAYDQDNDAYLNSQKKYLFTDAFLSWNLSELLKNLVLFAIMAMIGIRFNQRILGFSVGVIYMLINYVSRLFDPITMIVRMMTQVQQALAAAKRVFELLDQPVEVDQEASLTIKQADIDFDHVSFAYDGDNYILKDITFSVQEGQKVALVGHTGSGKSSIINLLFRFYDPQKGQIRIDGKVIQDYNRESVRQDMGIVLQDPYLFTGTIASNVSMNQAGISDQMVEEALIKVGAGPLLAKLDQGIQSPVVEKGQDLSSGERQLISFARALASDPKILILDEATSHIDTETESLIQHAMQVVQTGRTSIVVAHRLSTIMDADLILVLDQGEIVELGNHRSLLAAGGSYAQMYQAQVEEAGGTAP